MLKKHVLHTNIQYTCYNFKICQTQFKKAINVLIYNYWNDSEVFNKPFKQLYFNTQI